MIGPCTGLCLRNTQQSQETNIHVPGGIRTRNPENRATPDTPKLSFGENKGRIWFCGLLVEFRTVISQNNRNVTFNNVLVSVGVMECLVSVIYSRKYKESMIEVNVSCCILDSLTNCNVWTYFVWLSLCKALYCAGSLIK